MPILEIVSYIASDALLKDSTLTHHAFEPIRNWQGVHHIYEGISVDDDDLNRRWLLIVWNEYEDHKSLMDDKEIYPQVTAKLRECINPDGGFEMCHVLFNDDTRNALIAPVTEIADLDLKQPDNKEDLKEVMINYINRSRSDPVACQHAPFVFGEKKEKANSYLFVGGWASKQAHLDCVTGLGNLRPDVEKIGEFADYKVYHFQVKEYNRG